MLATKNKLLIVMDCYFKLMLVPLFCIHSHVLINAYYKLLQFMFTYYFMFTSLLCIHTYSKLAGFSGFFNVRFSINSALQLISFSF